MSKLEIRRVQPHESAAWFKMRIESLYDCPSAFLSSPETELAQGADFFRKRIAEGGEDNVIFACFDGEICVGSVGVVREEHLKANHKAFIWGMYVSPSYRGQKLGRQLLETAIDFAKNTMKVERVSLSVDSARVAAKNLYLSMGFQKWGTEKRAVRIDGQYFDEDYMSLDFATRS
jgi:RimJ/RimL family protein N-acetyltransferase